MNEKMLVVCDREIRYANHLADYISGRKEFRVNVYTCSSIEKVLELAEEKEIHIFVVDEKYKYDERCKVKANQTFVLGKEKIVDLGTKESGICKYQCADEIIRQIFETYVEKTNEPIMRSLQREATKITAVYSPIHRVGKTTFAIQLGLAYAQTERVLYLNLEEHAGLEFTFDEGLDLGDLLYYVKQGNEHLGLRLQVAVRKIGKMDYIEPIAVSLDLKETAAKEWNALLDQIEENGNYERVILDLSESVEGLYDILTRCDRIYTPILEDEISRRKIRRYINELETLKLETILQRTSQFVMPENIEEYARIRIKEDT